MHKRDHKCQDQMIAEVDWTPPETSQQAGFAESVRRLAHADTAQSKAAAKPACHRHLCSMSAAKLVSP